MAQVANYPAQGGGGTVAASPEIKESRQVWSRTSGNTIIVTEALPPGKLEEGCCACIPAPDMCPGWAGCLCCGLPTYIKETYEDSKFVLLTEQGLLFNDPAIVPREESCGGKCPFNICYLKIEDSVTYLPWDSSTMKSVLSNESCTDATMQKLCGGDGVEVEVAYKWCCFFKSPTGGCVPVCCAAKPCRRKCPGCIKAYSVMVKQGTGREARDKIINARENAKSRIKFQPY